MTLNDLKLRLLGLYPPFLGAGIRARRIPNGWESTLRLSLLNRNYFGTHFGGSLYAMCDPFFALILAERLPGYGCGLTATIRFRASRYGPCQFEIDPERVDEIRRQVERDGKCEPAFDARVLDQAGLVVAEVDKLLYVRLRDRPGG